MVVAEPRDEFDFVWCHRPSGAERDALVVQVADLVPRPAIIYTTTVEDADSLYGRLRERGYQRLAQFTGDIDDPARRKQVLDSWALGELDLVVATSAFGMGVDKANVRSIVHACLPESAERLYQEIGRGGRDGHQALSLCLWTNGDASTAASLAVHGWMRPETAVRRWRAILYEATSKGYLSHSQSGGLLIKVALDARHEGLEQVTGQLNRQWNEALMTLLQRSGALRIVGDDSTALGTELWVAEVLRPDVVTDRGDLDKVLAPFLSLGESEVSAARQKAIDLERLLLNRDEGCSRTLLFDMVESAGAPWPCGRCSVCVEVGERPRTLPNRTEFGSAWSDHAWLRPCLLSGGAWVVNPEEATLVRHLDRLVARLAGRGIEQFVTTTDMIGALERSVCEANLDLGFTLLLGENIPPTRVPTAVLIGASAHEPERVRKNCLALRIHFEARWRELPLVFVLSPDLGETGVPLAQHLSSQAPIAEQDLTRDWFNT